MGIEGSVEVVLFFALILPLAAHVIPGNDNGRLEDVGEAFHMIKESQVLQMLTLGLVATLFLYNPLSQAGDQPLPAAPAPAPAPAPWANRPIVLEDTGRTLRACVHYGVQPASEQYTDVCMHVQAEKRRQHAFGRLPCVGDES